MATKLIDHDLNLSSVSKIVGALINPVTADPGSPGVGELWFRSDTGRLMIQTSGGSEALALLTDVTGGAITGNLWDAQSVVVAVTDNSPAAVTLAEGTVLGRLAGGNIGAVTHANLLAALEAIGIDATTVGGSTEADLLARANHTGTQTAATISDFNSAADARAQAIVDAVIDAAPGTLDTLNELAAALGDDPNFATTVTNSIATKTGKFAANFGNAALQTFTINHALGTTDVIVQVRVNASTDVVDCEIEITDANNVTIKTNSVPGSNAYRVVVIG